MQVPLAFCRLKRASASILARPDTEAHKDSAGHSTSLVRALPRPALARDARVAASPSGNVGAATASICLKCA